MTGSICKIDPDGSKHWYLNGLRHREDGPAIEYTDGTKYWYLNGKRHREDGPAIDHPDGKYWYLNDESHREDGPAVKCSNGYKEWSQYGKLHREDGPAIEYTNKTKAWYLNGNYYGRTKPENWDELVLLAQVEKMMTD